MPPAPLDDAPLEEVAAASLKTRSFGLHPRMAIAVVSAASEEAS
jgi:hypothetical protein